MEEKNRSRLIKYIICFIIASVISLLLFWHDGFFTSSLARNLMVLGNGLSISGAIFLMIAGMLYISGEGGFLGIGYALRSVVRIFVPVSKRHFELYGTYRERKLKELKKSSDRCILVVGLVFFSVGVLLLGIWTSKFYNVS